MLEMAMHVLVQMQVHTWPFEKKCNNSVWGMFLTNVVQVRNDLAPSIQAIILSHCTTLLFICLQKGAVFKWKPHLTESCFPLLPPEKILRNPVSFCQHTRTLHFSCQQSICQNILTDKKCRILLATSSKLSLETIQSLIHWVYGIKAAGVWSWANILFIMKLTNEWSYNLFPCIFSWCWERNI